jgi:hypothetical protein
MPQYNYKHSRIKPQNGDLVVGIGNTSYYGQGRKIESGRFYRICEVIHGRDRGWGSSLVRFHTHQKHKSTNEKTASGPVSDLFDIGRFLFVCRQGDPNQQKKIDKAKAKLKAIESAQAA